MILHNRAWRTASVAALCLAAAAIGGCKEGASRMEQGFEDGFKTNFVETFTKSCKAGAEASGAPADKVAGICQCAADELAKKYSASELMSLSPETATPVITECAAKSGLPV